MDFSKLLSNPRIYKKEEIPDIPKEVKLTKKEEREKQKEEEQRIINEQRLAAPVMSPLEFLKTIHSDIFTPLLDKNNNPYIIDGGAIMVVKCKFDHVHKLPSREINDGAKCPTCTNGTLFSRNMIKTIRDEFNMILLFVSATDDEIEYSNPAIKLKIIVMGNEKINNRLNQEKINEKNIAKGKPIIGSIYKESFEKKDDMLVVRLLPKPKKNLITFLRTIFMIYKYIPPTPMKKMLPFTADSFSKYNIPLDINDANIIDDTFMLFENC